MKPEELLQRKNMFVNYDRNFGLMIKFSKSKMDQYYSIECRLLYNVKEKNWGYHFLNTKTLKNQEYQEKKGNMRKIIEELTTEPRKEREYWADTFLSSFRFTHDYELIRTDKGNQKIVYLISATMQGQQAEVKLNISSANNIQFLELVHLIRRSDGKILRGASFLFSWKFAKECFPGLKEFETFLYTKSKDRLTLLLT